MGGKLDSDHCVALLKTELYTGTKSDSLATFAGNISATKFSIFYINMAVFYINFQVSKIR
jgi:hypothetical protein